MVHHLRPLGGVSSSSVGWIAELAPLYCHQGGHCDYLTVAHECCCCYHPVVSD